MVWRRNKGVYGRDIHKYHSEENLTTLKRKIPYLYLVVLDNDVVGALSLFKLAGPRNASRCQRQLELEWILMDQNGLDVRVNWGSELIKKRMGMEWIGNMNCSSLPDQETRADVSVNWELE